MPSKTRSLKSTLYYPAPLVALPGKPQGALYKGYSDRATIHTVNGPMIVHVDPRKHYLAAIEASAIVDLGALGPHMGSLGLSYHPDKNNWNAWPDSHFGVGNVGQPLVPGRDFANNSWPHGTQITWGPSLEAENHLQGVMYKADRFGSEQDENRVDLFVGVSTIAWGMKNIRAEVNKPWNGVSVRAVKGGQQCLNILGYEGSDGQVLKEDNSEGPKTRFALLHWLGRNRNQHFPWGVPEHKRLRDPEIYFQLRVAARDADQS